MTTNAEIAAQFEELADRLLAQHESWFKVAAYRKAAATIRAADGPVEAMAARGALRTLPGIGAAIATKIQDYLTTGHIPALDRVRAAQGLVPIGDDVAPAREEQSTPAQKEHPTPARREHPAPTHEGHSTPAHGEHS